MESPKFVYVLHINTTPEQLWNALTNPDFTQQYWDGRRVQSDWTVGASVKHFKPLHVEDLLSEPASQVTFEIEDFPGKSKRQGAVVKLTVTHDEFPAESKIFPMISQGWPDILSSLKTLLETGVAIEFQW